MLLRVIPTRPDLPRLRYSRFRTLPQGTWPKALGVICGYIDNEFKVLTSQCPQKGSYGGSSELGPTDRSRIDELLRLRDQLQSELNRLQARSVFGPPSLPPSGSAGGTKRKLSSSSSA